MMRVIPLLMLALGGCERAPSSADAAAVEAPPAVPVPGAGTPARAVQVTPTIRILELAGTMTLSEAERGQLVVLEARERASNPARAAKEDAELKSLLTRYDRANTVQKAKLRHAIRAALYFERAKLTDPLPGQLLARHDPVLVEDLERKEIVTRADIKALDASNRYIAKIAGTAVPDMTEKPGEREELQRRYRADGSLRTVLTHAGPRHATLVAAMDGLPAAKRAEVDRVIRAEVHTPEDAANAARGAENAVIVAQQRLAQRARDRAALADFNRWVWERNQVQLGMAKLDGMMRVLNTENITYPR